MGKTGVLLINLGTPEAPNAEKVGTYLKEFLMDKWVVDIPYIFRWLLVNGIILRTRPATSAALYAKVWMKEGSPLLYHSFEFTNKLQEHMGEKYFVTLGMRYGSPSIKSAVEKLKERGVSSVMIFPLYPQYSLAATQSSLEEVKKVFSELKYFVPTKVIPPFYGESSFTDSFVEIAKPLLEQKNPDHVIFSFHGLPERQVKKTDPSGAHCLADPSCCNQVNEVNSNCYRAQCFATAKILGQKLKLRDGLWSVSFQSRLGRTPWIKPYTDFLYEELPKKGVKNLLVLSPSFVADCLETLEEIAMRGREQFVQAGGADLTLVPSLNSNMNWVRAAGDIIVKNMN